MPGYYGNPRAARYYRLLEDLRPLAKDIEFYAPSAGGSFSVLELGVGTGRVAVELAARGARVTGIDRWGAMLELAAERAEARGVADRVALVETDMRHFALNERFDMVCIPYYGFGYMHSLPDQLSCLRCILQHLSPNGRFILHAYQPDPRYFGSLLLGFVGGPVLESRGVYPLTNDNVLAVDFRTTYARATQKLTSTIVFEEIEPSGAARKTVVQDSAHVFFRYELELLLSAVGFTVEAVFGGFDRAPLRDDSSEMIFVAAAAA